MTTTAHHDDLNLPMSSLKCITAAILFYVLIIFFVSSIDVSQFVNR